MTWMAPRTVAEAVGLKAERPDATLVAGGTFVGILTRQGLLASDDWISLQNVRELRELSTGSELALGAMVTHRRIELDPGVAAGWPGVRQVFAAVASPRVRNAATIGGVLGDADYASDPPAMLIALDAWVEALSVRGLRRVPVADLIVDHYQTSLEEDELITRVLVPRVATTSPFASCVPAARRTGPASRSPPPSTRAGSRSSWARSPSVPSASPTSARRGTPQTAPAQARSRPATPTASIPSATTAARRPTGPG